MNKENKTIYKIIDKDDSYFKVKPLDGSGSFDWYYLNIYWSDSYYIKLSKEKAMVECI